MKNIIKYTFILFLAVSSTACNKWLNAPVNDKIMEGDLFAEKEKFLSAINGVYIELVSSDSYGGDFGYGVVDVMAQYYNVGNGNHRYSNYGTYAYGEKNVKTTFENLWNKSYFLIANCNTIVEKCDESPEILGEKLNNIIKGEALALRAMLHLDILRLYGPIYSDDTKDKVAIPYMTDSDQKIQPLQSSDKILDFIIGDLNTALTLLAKDPVITEGRLNSENANGDNQLHYRQYRMNYFAVKAVLARANMWKGNKTEALKIATELISTCQSGEEPLFPFTTSASALHASYPDRMFSTEVLFALYNMKRTNVYKDNFAPVLSNTGILSFAGDIATGRVQETYPDGNDYRRKMWEKSIENNKEVVYFTKFADVVGSVDYSAEGFRYMMPLIKLSEMYLIAAECTTVHSDALEYVNKLRRARACADASANEDGLQALIVDESRREYIGEGQLFFLYKRKAMQSIPNGALNSGNMQMALGNYIVPLPDSEISQRPDYEK